MKARGQRSNTVLVFEFLLSLIDPLEKMLAGDFDLVGGSDLSRTGADNGSLWRKTCQDAGQVPVGESLFWSKFGLPRPQTMHQYLVEAN